MDPSFGLGSTPVSYLGSVYVTVSVSCEDGVGGCVGLRIGGPLTEPEVVG